MKKIYLIIIIFFIMISSTVFAHSGRTDSNGGHYDRSTGEYHYHHGYSSHKHYNGYCPYEEGGYTQLFPSSCPNCNSSIITENGEYCFECGYRVINLSDYNAGMFVSGDPQKTREQYFQEVQSLEAKIEEKERHNQQSI